MNSTRGTKIARLIAAIVVVAGFLLARERVGPLSCYGIVRDEDGLAVPDARVEYSVLSIAGTRTKGDLRTDSLGRFALRRTGLSVFFSASKPGYKQELVRGRLPLSQVRVDFDDSLGKREGGSKDEPVVMGLRRLKNPVHVRKIIYSESLQPGVPLELTMGKDGPSLTGEFHLGDGGRSTQNKRYSWSFRLTSNEVSFREVEDPEISTAPDAGYKSEIKCDMPSDGSVPYSYELDRLLWVLTKEGVSGRVRLHVVTYPDRGVISLKGYFSEYLNDRNLETD